MAGTIQRHNHTSGQPTPRSHPLMTLRDEVDRLFDSFFPMARGTMLDPFRAMEGTFGTMTDMMPQVDVKETDDRYELTAELAGMDDSDVQVTVREGMLVISGEKKAEHKEEKADWHLSERTYGSFTRSFRLPDNVDEEKIEAAFDKGVLTVGLPKKAEAKTAEKKIEVKKHH